MTVAPYFFLSAMISGSGAKSPSIENTPSTMISFTASGSHFCNLLSKSAMSLCL